MTAVLWFENIACVSNAHAASVLQNVIVEFSVSHNTLAINFHLNIHVIIFYGDSVILTSFITKAWLLR